MSLKLVKANLGIPGPDDWQLHVEFMGPAGLLVLVASWLRLFQWRVYCTKITSDADDSTVRLRDYGISG